jgi:hypothetical protein
MKKFSLFIVIVGLSFFLQSCIVIQTPPPGNKPPAPEPETQRKWIDDTFYLGKNKLRVHVTGQSNDPNKYRICVRNSAGGKNKGMDWKDRQKPVFIAKKKNSVSCGEYHPKTVEWKFYRISGLKYRTVGSYTINAKGYEGKEITFDWLKD